MLLWHKIFSTTATLIYSNIAFIDSYVYSMDYKMGFFFVLHCILKHNNSVYLHFNTNCIEINLEIGCGCGWFGCNVDGLSKSKTN